MLTLLIILLCMLGFGFCIFMLHSSWVGRRVGTTPYCSKCGYNLSGRSGEATPCSECGSDLTAKRAVRIGERKRRLGRAVLFAFILVSGTVLSILSAFGFFTSFELIQHLPVWYLAWRAEGQSTVAGQQAPALDELRRRQMNGELSNSQTVAVIERALQIQGDTSLHWNDAWGELVETECRNGRLTPALAQRYASQLVERGFLVLTRSRIREGDSIPVLITIYEPRCGSNWISLDVSAELSIGQFDCSEILPTEPMIILGSRNYSEDRIVELSSRKWRQLPRGRHLLEATLTIDVSSNFGGVFSISNHSIFVNRSIPLEVVQLHEPVVGRTNRAQAEPTIRVEHVIVENAKNGTSEIRGRLQASSESINAIFDLFIRVNGREHFAGHVDPVKGDARYSGYVFRIASETDPADLKTVDVILRPNIRRAESLIRGPFDMDTIWGEPIEILNVPVRR